MGFGKKCVGAIDGRFGVGVGGQGVPLYSICICFILFSYFYVLYVYILVQFRTTLVCLFRVIYILISIPLMSAEISKLLSDIDTPDINRRNIQLALVSRLTRRGFLVQLQPAWQWNQGHSITFPNKLWLKNSFPYITSFLFFSSCFPSFPISFLQSFYSQRSIEMIGVS